MQPGKLKDKQANASPKPVRQLTEDLIKKQMDERVYKMFTGYKNKVFETPSLK